MFDSLFIFMFTFTPNLNTNAELRTRKLERHYRLSIVS